MPFKLGPDPNRAKGGKRNPPGGRPTKEKQAAKKLAEEIAKDYIEKNIKPIMETYVGLASGEVIERMTAGGKKDFFLSVDPATSRHAVDKLIPPETKLVTEGPISISVTIQGNTNGKSPA